MLYHIVKPLLRIIVHLVYKKLYVSNMQILQQQGPVMLVANHPNSFFDAILLGAILKRPIYTLTRADVFTNKITIAILKAMKLIPIYRLKDGKGNLAKNDNTFEACIEVFNTDGIILIFGEAKCEGQYELLPLQKGGIKIAMHAWQAKGLANQTTIVPVAINYSQLNGWRKVGTVVFGNAIEKPTAIANEVQHPFIINDIRKQLYQFFDKALVQQKQITEVDKQQWQYCFEQQVHASNAATFIATVQTGIHNPPKHASKKIDMLRLILKVWYFPFFYMLKLLCNALNNIGKVHYDSFMVCGAVLLYPLYLTAIFGLLCLCTVPLVSMYLTIVYALGIGMAYKPIVYSNP